jgi:hypothetical protein
VTANIDITALGAIPSTFAHHQDPTMYVDDEILLVATFHNSGDHPTGQFKVMLLLDGANVHEEWITDLHPLSHHDVSVARRGIAEGGHTLEAWADLTQHVAESEEGDNHAAGEFVVHPGSRKDQYIDEPEQTVEVHVSDAEWEKAGWKRVTVNVQIWDFLNNPLEHYDVYLMIEGQTDWLMPEHQMQQGAARFTHVMVHPSGALHLGCHAREDNAHPYLTGVFTAAINADQAVVIDAWQDTDIETWQDTDLDAKTKQWSISAKTSVKGGFKVLGVGAEVSAEVGGSYGESGTHTTGTARTHRVLIAKDDLVPQRPQRAV